MSSKLLKPITLRRLIGYLVVVELGLADRRILAKISRVTGVPALKELLAWPDVCPTLTDALQLETMLHERDARKIRKQRYPDRKSPGDLLLPEAADVVESVKGFHDDQSNGERFCPSATALQDALDHPERYLTSQQLERGRHDFLAEFLTEVAPDNALYVLGAGGREADILELETASPEKSFHSLTAFRSMCFDHQVKTVIHHGFQLLERIEACRLAPAEDKSEDGGSVFEELRAATISALQISLRIAGWWLSEPPTWDDTSASLFESLCRLARRIVCLAAIASGELREKITENDYCDAARMCDAKHFAVESDQYRTIIVKHWAKVRAAIVRYDLLRDIDFRRVENDFRREAHDLLRNPPRASIPARMWVPAASETPDETNLSDSTLRDLSDAAWTMAASEAYHVWNEQREPMEASKSSQPTGIGEDGPTEAGFFVWADMRFPFANLQWRLLKALWKKGSVEFEVIGNKVWGDSEWNDGRLRKLVSDTNGKLLVHNLPFEIISPMDAHYFLQKLPPVTPGVTGK